jgi:uncharacterized ion transporter superfamily protein YfcC
VSQKQVIVTTFSFGVGFSNMDYPTYVVLLICLGLSAVSSPKWLRWAAEL